MTRNKKIIAVLVALVTAFAFGRFTAPESVKRESETHTVENTDKNKDEKTNVEKDKHVEKVVIEVVRPDGTKETTTRIVEDTKLVKEKDKTTTETNRKTTNEKTTEEIVYGRNRLIVTALVAVKPNFFGGDGGVVYGAQVQKQFLGPIYVGLWGLLPNTVGASLGLSF